MSVPVITSAEGGKVILFYNRVLFFKKEKDASAYNVVDRTEIRVKETSVVYLL
jgi:hypothetical protein